MYTCLLNIQAPWGNRVHTHRSSIIQALGKSCSDNWVCGLSLERPLSTASPAHCAGHGFVCVLRSNAVAGTGDAAAIFHARRHLRPQARLESDPHRHSIGFLAYLHLASSPQAHWIAAGIGLLDTSVSSM